MTIPMYLYWKFALLVVEILGPGENSTGSNSTRLRGVPGPGHPGISTWLRGVPRLGHPEVSTRLRQEVTCADVREQPIGCPPRELPDKGSTSVYVIAIGRQNSSHDSLDLYFGESSSIFRELR